MVKRWAGALGGALLFASGVARAERPKIFVLPVAGKTADADFRKRVGQSLSEGLIASGADVVAPTATALPEGCTTAACLSGAARATGAAFLLRAVVDEEGRSYTFKLEMLDGQSGAVLAQRENRCEICTDAEALEIANAAASALKAQAVKKPAAPPAPPQPTGVPPSIGGDRPASPRGRVTVLDRLELPASLGEFHAKLRTALEALVREQGLEVVPAPTVPANCGSASCAEDRLRSSGASHVLFIEGSRNDYGFSLDITLRGVAGGDSEKAQGWCNFCTGPQMVTAAENVARPLVVHLAARPDRAPGVAPGAPRANLTAPGDDRRASNLTRVLLGAGLVAAGGASIVAGSFTWNRAGSITDCVPAPEGGTPVCREIYGGKNLGIGMVIGGAILAGVGGYLMMFTGTKAQLAVNPGGVSVAGTF
jgi:hypothetical protein